MVYPNAIALSLFLQFTLLLSNPNQLVTRCKLVGHLQYHSCILLSYHARKIKFIFENCLIKIWIYNFAENYD